MSLYARLGAAVLVSLTLGCAARGHIATPQEIARLHEAKGLSASGRLVLSGPRGKLSARVVFGVARPDSLRIEIPSGAGLRFLLVTKNGLLRADLPQDNATFVGPATQATMETLFGIDVAPEALVSAILANPPDTIRSTWRFDRAAPRQITLQGSNPNTLALTLDDPDLQAPAAGAFDTGPRLRVSLSAAEMSERLGLRK